MSTLLVTGASGFLGYNICRQAVERYQVFGTYGSRGVAVDGIATACLDLRNRAEIVSLFNKVKPDVVIHAAAAADPNFCQLHPAESGLVNVEATVTIAQLCAADRIPLAFTSTDLAFDGLNAPYSENSSTGPISVYGGQKIFAETRIGEIYPEACICRMPLMFGDGGPFAKSFIQPIIHSIQNNLPLKLFVDEFRTPAYAVSAAQGILMMLESSYSGVIHLGGKERISRYEFGKKIASILNPDAAIEAVLLTTSTMAAPRPADVSLNSAKAFALGYSPLSIDEALKDILG